MNYRNFYDFIESLNKIPELRRTKPNIKDTLDKAKPSTKFGLGGLGLTADEYKKVYNAFVIETGLSLDRIKHNPQMTIHQFMDELLRAEHEHKRNSLNNHLNIVETNGLL